MRKIKIIQMIFVCLFALSVMFLLSYIVVLPALVSLLGERAWLLEGIVINLILFFSLGRQELKEQKEKNQLNKLLGSK